jgi:hypothetical protein
MENVAPMLRSAKAGKPLKLSDFINVFANQIEKIEREEENATENRKEVASRKKNTGATRKQRATP